MKILLLNPHINAEHQIARNLKSRGVAILVSANSEEAWQMLQLHGSSVDLAVLHREGAGMDPGVKLLSKIKQDPVQKDLPAVLTTESWSDVDCARHQETPQGANAYLKWPFTENQLAEMIEAVLGQQIGAESSIAIPAPSVGTSSISQIGSTGGTGMFLQEASEVLGSNPVDMGGIQLEAPSMSNGPGGNGGPGSGSAPLIPTASGTTVQGRPREISMPDIEVAELTHSEMSIPRPTKNSEPIEIKTMEPQTSDSNVEVELADIGTRVDAELLIKAKQEQKRKSPLKPVPPPISEAIDSSEDLEIIESEIAQEMPYLFSGSNAKPVAPRKLGLSLVETVGDAVVPGGAAQAPDTETLKKYLMLREQDVAALSTQLKAAGARMATLEAQLRDEASKNSELSVALGEYKKKVDDFDKEKSYVQESAQGEISDLKFQMKTKVDKARVLEEQVRAATEEMDRLKERVRVDIRKIRVREKELENRLEIARKDAEALIGARETKIIELKRKLDLLEFNMDLLQDSYARERENSASLREKLGKAAQAVRAAGGLLDTPGGPAKREAS